MKKVIYLTILSGIHAFSLSAQYAEVEDWSVEINIEDSRKMTLTERKRIKILKKEGYDQSIFTSYEDKFSKISTLEIVVYDENGEKIKRRGKSDSREYVFNDQNEIDDTKLIFLEPEYQSYPFVVEVESEQRFNKGFLNLPSWIPRSDFRTEVKKASLTIHKPINYQLNYDLTNIGEPEVTNSKDGEVLKWEVSNLEAIDNDISYGQFYRKQPRVSLSPVRFELDNTVGSFESWESFGQWYISLNSEPYEFSNETRVFLDQVSGTKREIVDQLYDYLQKKSRYISIQLGIGGFKSLPVDFVDKNGYGDCKALSTYMKSMLDYKNINANFILVNAGNDIKDLNKDFVSNQFNHVFVGVPFESDTVFLECTSQMLPPGYLGSFTDDRNVLWLEDGNSKLIHSPQYDEVDNVLSINGEVQLDPFGNGKLMLNSNRSGFFYDDILWLKSVGEGQIKTQIGNRFDFKDFQVNSFDFEEVGEKVPEYTEDFEITVNNMVRTSGEKILIPTKILPSVDAYFKFNRYKRIGEISRSFTLLDSIKIVPPNGYVLRIPETVTIEDSFGSFTSELVDHEDGTYSIKTKTILKKGLFLEEDFEDFNAFLTKVKRKERSSILLEKRT